MESAALPKVLLIEDDEDDYDLTREAFAEMPTRYEVDWRKTYDEGLLEAARGQHAVCLVDYRLGPRSGIDLVRQATLQGARAPFILLTGQGDHEVDLEAMRAGASDYIDKGQLNAGLLERSIRYALDRRRLQSQLMFADRMISVGTLAAGAAHEINNPLAFVISSLSFALSELRENPKRALQNPGELISALVDAQAGTDRIRRIVHNLTTFSRAEDERSGLIDLKPVLEAAVTMVDKEVRSRARLVVALSPTPRVTANEARLSQVFVNLLLNAANATAEGRDNTISLTTAVGERGRVEVSVADTGSGIAPEIRERIFDPFFTTKLTGATGLGLSICHGIVSSLGGRIELTTEVGKGSTFTVCLPAA